MKALNPGLLRWTCDPKSFNFETTTEIRETYESLGQGRAERISVAYKKDGDPALGDLIEIYFDEDFVIRQWTISRAAGAESRTPAPDDSTRYQAVFATVAG
jgi:hypothetical protein